MGSQTAAGQNVSDPARRLPRMRRPGQPTPPMVPDALGRAINRTDRLDALTRELRDAGKQGRTSAWLAERLGVSARTVKRDIAALQQTGVPIRASSGPQGGYVMDAAIDYSNRPLTFTADEVLAVVVGLQAVPDQPFGAAARTAVGKLLHALTPEGRADIARLAERVWIRPGEPAAEADDAVREAISTAVRERQLVLLDYQPAEGPPRLIKQVEPLGFAHSLGHWFVLAWSRDDDGGRWFRLDWIAAAQPTHERFEPRDVREVFGTTPAQPSAADTAADTAAGTQSGTQSGTRADAATPTT
jgi:predicted DNA-binding transcriptional regulator YafY